MGFNSILVRLKENESIQSPFSSNPFQFHTGSIKSREQRPARTGTRRFQFHTGSIKSRLDELGFDWDFKFQFHTGSIKRKWKVQEKVSGACFNSILVRLKARHEHTEQYTRRCFNSILVRLKVAAARARMRTTSLMFQFHTGSIKRQYIAAIPNKPSMRVSIPYWFD